MDEPARALAKLEPHQLRSRLAPPVRAVEAATGLVPDKAARVACTELFEMDRVVREYADLYATLAGSAT
jgi:hypothetical protein